MSSRRNTNESYEKLNSALTSGLVGNFYIFHGEERYLLEHSLNTIRQLMCPDGLESFNYRRYEGKDLQLDDFENAIDTLPAFAERTLIEVHDFDLFKGRKTSSSNNENSTGPSTSTQSKDDKERIASIMSNLPEYVCLVIIYNTLEFKPDNRVKLDKEIQSHCQVVEFPIQEQSKLINWISRRFSALGKRISNQDAIYMAHITDGYMAALVSEIEKVSAYSDNDTISRSDIDAVVIPVVNAFAYTLTDALLEGNAQLAINTLEMLFSLREPAQKIIYSISLKMRQLLTARVCIENGISQKEFMEICSIRFDFQARILMDTARKTTLDKCCNAVIYCSQAAYDLNSSPEPESRLIELLLHILSD
ncbi:MAG: DNA polymerase III subunit delta [Oscillospiraceae bacterium]|nr:DNA polymerase III subunit delta [Oscillospiraceae bacterium]